MNCPMHCLIFRSRMRSYRELPLRLFELGTVYRYERAGTLHGLLRIRGFTQDDSHIFCTREQAPAEIRGLLELRAVGAAGLRVRGVRGQPVDPGPDEVDRAPTRRGTQATETLREALVAEGLAYEVKEGDAAFYGPKIDIDVRDAIGRRWQLSTIQYDFNLPERFDLEYVGADNERHQPVMVHRALFGSVERFFGVLVEHFAGAFPAWLAPVQARVLPVATAHEAYAEQIVARLHGRGVPGRPGRGDRPARQADPGRQAGEDPLRAGGRRRRCGRRAPSGVNPRGGEVERGVPVEDFVARLRAEVAVAAIASA